MCSCLRADDECSFLNLFFVLYFSPFLNSSFVISRRKKNKTKKNFFEHNRGRPVDLDILLLAIERVPVRFSFRNGLLSGQYISHSGLSSFKLKKILEPLFFFFFFIFLPRGDNMIMLSHLHSFGNSGRNEWYKSLISRMKVIFYSES